MKVLGQLTKRMGYLSVLLAIVWGLVFGLSSDFLRSTLTAISPGLASDNQSSKNYYFPFYFGQNYKTTISLAPLSNQQINAQLGFYDQEGIILKQPSSLAIPATGIIQNLGVESAASPSAKILRVVANKDLFANSILVSPDGKKTEIVPALGASSRQLDFPLLLAGVQGQKTITVVNLGSSAANPEAIALDAMGTDLGHRLLPILPSLASQTLSVDQLFNAPDSQQLATVRVIANGNLGGVQYFSALEGDLLALPALGATTSRTWYFPLVPNAQNIALWMDVRLFNQGETQSALTIEAFDAANIPLGTVATPSLLPGAIYSISNSKGGAIPSQATMLKVSANTQISGYSVIGVVDGKGLTAVAGIPAEDQTTAGIDLAGSPDGQTLRASPLIRIEGGKLIATATLLTGTEWHQQASVMPTAAASVASSAATIATSTTAAQSTATLKPLLASQSLTGTTDGPTFFGASPSVKGSIAQLSFMADLANQKVFRWTSSDSILGNIDTVGFVSAASWQLVAGNPKRLVFTATAAGATFQGNVLFDSYNRAVVDIVKGSKRVRYLLGVIQLDIIEEQTENVVDALQIADGLILNAVKNNAVNPEPQPSPPPPPGTDPSVIFGSDLSEIAPRIQSVQIVGQERIRFDQHAVGLHMTILGGGFLKDATVGFTDAPAITVRSVTWKSVSELEAEIDVNADHAFRTQLTVTNPNELSATWGKPMYVGRDIDLGPEGSAVQPGFSPMGVVAKSGGNNVGYEDPNGIIVVDTGGSDPLLRDGHQSTREHTTFLVDAAPGGYEIKLYLGDTQRAIGPVTVMANGIKLAENVTVPAGQVQVIQGTAGSSAAGVLLIDLVNPARFTTIRALEIAPIDGSGNLRADKQSGDATLGLLVGQPSTITFYARAGEFDLSGGSARITIPNGLDFPQISDPSGAGYVRLDAGPEVAANLRIEGRAIVFDTLSFSPNSAIKVIYGDQSQGGAGVVATASDILQFQLETAGRGGSFQQALVPYEIEAVQEGEEFFFAIDPENFQTVAHIAATASSENDIPSIPQKSKFRIRALLPADIPLAIDGLRTDMVDAGGNVLERKDFEASGSNGKWISKQAGIVYRGEKDKNTAEYFESKGYKIEKADAQHTRIELSALHSGETVGKQPKPPAQIVEFSPYSNFTEKLDYFLSNKVKVTQVTTGKLVDRWMLKSPRWSLPNDAKIYLRAEVATVLVKDKTVNFLVKCSQKGTEDTKSITKLAQLTEANGDKSTYQLELSLNDSVEENRPLSGEIAVKANLMVDGKADPLVEGETMYDSREIGFISGSQDKNKNAQGIFNTVKSALKNLYTIVFDEDDQAYKNGKNNHLTDNSDLKFDTADFSWELMHGTRKNNVFSLESGILNPEYEKKENKDGTTTEIGVPPFSLRDVTTLGKKDNEWVVFNSCDLFSEFNSTEKNGVKGIEGFFDRYPFLFSNGLHLALGARTLMHSNLMLVGRRYQNFINQIKIGTPRLADEWASLQAFGPHGYNARGDWYEAFQGIAIGPNLKYGKEKTNIEDTLPIGGPQKLSPDFVALEDNDLGAIYSPKKKEDEFPVSISDEDGLKAQIINQEVNLKIKMTVAYIPQDSIDGNYLKTNIAVKLYSNGILQDKNATVTPGSSNLTVDATIKIDIVKYNDLRKTDQQFTIWPNYNTKVDPFWARSKPVSLPAPPTE
jgi:hypothetical protein